MQRRKTTSTYYAWAEWYPGGEIEITNFAVYPGAPIFVLIKVSDASSGFSAAVTFVNLESNQYTTIGLTPSGPFGGDSAEWILERPASSGKLSSLADYGAIWMSSELALNGYSDVYSRGNRGADMVAETFTMYDSNNNPLSTSSSLGSAAQVLKVKGVAHYRMLRAIPDRLARNSGQP